MAGRRTTGLAVGGIGGEGVRVCVTGSGGFIGSAVISELEMAGHEPVEYSLPKHDVTDQSDVTAILADCEAVIHLAGMLGTHELFDTPHAAVQTNVLGTVNILEACKTFGLQYVGITMPAVFPSIYTATKLCTQKLATAYRHTYGIGVSHVKAYNAFGRGQAHGPGHPQKIIPTFARYAWNRNPIPIWGDGRQTVDLIHVDDLAQLLVQALSFTDDEVIEGGTGEPFTVNEVAEMVGDITGYHGVVYLPMRRGEKATHIAADADDSPVGLPEFRYSDLVATVEWYR